MRLPSGCHRVDSARNNGRTFTTGGNAGPGLRTGKPAQRPPDPSQGEADRQTPGSRPRPGRANVPRSTVLRASNIVTESDRAPPDPVRNSAADSGRRMAGLATLAAVPRSAGSERDADQARCDRCLRAVTHGHAEICSAARSQCGEPRPGTGPADPAACTLCPWRGQGPDLARHCARVRDRRSRTGSPAVTATYRRGKAGVATAPGEAGPGPRPVAPKPRAVWIGSSRRPAVR